MRIFGFGSRADTVTSIGSTIHGMAPEGVLRYTCQGPQGWGNPCLPGFGESQHRLSQTREKMPKLKTHSGAAKRFKKTGTGKIKRNQTKTRHILSSKSPKVKRKLGKSVLVSDGDYAKVARMIPYA